MLDCDNKQVNIGDLIKVIIIDDNYWTNDLGLNYNEEEVMRMRFKIIKERGSYTCIKYNDEIIQLESHEYRLHGGINNRIKIEV